MVPDGWVRQRLGKYLKESRIAGTDGSVAKKITVKLYGKGVFGKDEKRQGSENTKYFKRKSGQFIYSKLDFLNGAFGIIPQNLDRYESTADMPAFDSIAEINLDWLLYHFSRDSFYKSFAGNAAGGRKAKRIQVDEFLNIEISFPPIPEQKRIAEVLGSVDAAIEATKAVIDQTKAVKQGLLQTLLTRGIGHTKFKNSSLGEIPETWESVKFEKLAKINDGTHKTPTYVDSGVPFLRVTDIKEGAINLKNAKYITRKEHNELIKRCRPERGDILYSKNGTIGVARLVDWDWEFSVFVSLALIKIKDREYTSPDFLNIVLASCLIDNQIRNRTKQGTVSNLHLEEIREFDIPVPPASEQRDIVKICHALDRELSVEDAKLTTLLTLKRGLMNDLLSGKVRVSLTEQSEHKSANTVVPFLKKTEQSPLRKQAVLTAEIISLLRPEWVGMTKREKTFDVVARQLGLEDTLMRQPERWVAGPYDPQSRHAVDPILETEGWIKTEVDSKGIYSFTEGANHGAHKAEFDAFFSNEADEISRIAKALRTNNSQFFEIVATLHAAWNDLKLEGKAPTNDEIIAEVYQWHDAKREIPKVDWLNGLDWIRRQHLEPKGIGKMTKAATLI
jgi:type I restriction enzyme S subunit